MNIYFIKKFNEMQNYIKFIIARGLFLAWVVLCILFYTENDLQMFYVATVPPLIYLIFEILLVIVHDQLDGLLDNIWWSLFRIFVIVAICTLYVFLSVLKELTLTIPIWLSLSLFLIFELILTCHFYYKNDDEY